MVRDGYFYALGLIVAGMLVGWFARPAWALVPFLLARFFLWFFRDPERVIPETQAPWFLLRMEGYGMFPG